jgi:CO dehydrogenase maturation factor
MRIAFVGKGGSGKTTLSALFSQYIKDKAPVLVIDADLNMHLPALLGFQEIPQEMHISHPSVVKTIKSYLRGTNKRIRELVHFRKTTPPANGSRFIVLHNSNDTILKQFSVGNPNFRLMVVGTYDTDDIGASCYHNNLAILENVISHLVDTKGNLVTDMVAGVDAFANTLHAQFDMLVLAVEPTKRGVEVYNQYQKLAGDAGVGNLLFVVGNKVRNSADKEFISKHIPNNRLLGFLGDSEYLRIKDQKGGQLDVAMLEPENKKTIEVIANKLFSIQPDYTARLQRLYELHRRYVAQDFIRERFGDLTNHIDETFDLESSAKEHV